MCALDCLSQEENRKCCTDYSGLVKFFLNSELSSRVCFTFLHFLTSLFRILIYECSRELINVTGSENDTNKHGVASFSKERNTKLGAGSVSLLFSRLTSPEQTGLKCSV